jgi:IS5 family transposase
MLRTYFVRQWYNLYDLGEEEALYESTALRRFVGVDLGVAPTPDETTNPATFQPLTHAVCKQ